jgi:hypothetical protein
MSINHATLVNWLQPKGPVNVLGQQNQTTPTQTITNADMLQQINHSTQTETTPQRSVQQSIHGKT